MTVKDAHVDDDHIIEKFYHNPGWMIIMLCQTGVCSLFCMMKENCDYDNNNDDAADADDADDHHHDHLHNRMLMIIIIMIIFITLWAKECGRSRDLLAD